MKEQNADLNLIGAFALKIHDLQMAATTEVSGLSPAASACLVSLTHQVEVQTIRDLASICGLSHSATVRVINKLQEDEYVCRVNAEHDQREVYVCLTIAGYKMRDKILDARRAAIEPVFATVSDEDRQTVSNIAGSILSALTGSRIESEHICRLCDAISCGGDSCPVEMKALTLEAAALA
ncbi:MAG: MarR family transcriptional regulator [Hyphomicrobiales bacterium]